MPGQKETKQLLEDACGAVNVVSDVVCLAASLNNSLPAMYLRDVMSLSKAQGKMNALMSFAGDFPPKTLLDHVDVTMSSIEKSFNRLMDWPKIKEEFGEGFKYLPIEESAQKIRKEAHGDYSELANQSSVEIIQGVRQRALELKEQLELVATHKDSPLPGS